MQSIQSLRLHSAPLVFSKIIVNYYTIDTPLTEWRDVVALYRDGGLDTKPSASLGPR
jgi:hypothetical protein